MAETITSGITSAITAVGNVLTAVMTGSWSAVLPLVGLAVGFYVCRVGIRIIKSLVQGY